MTAPTQPTQRLGDEEGPPEELPRGTLLGRYIIVNPIGRGGMGRVYSAYDPELDRRVAMKLVRTAGSSGQLGRLRKEAQALARLAHPNVVAVHDVGESPPHLFLAMELVEGANLREWLREARRTPGEVREVLAQAGRGLAAAHGAGLVHGDFKPDNVLVGRDCRVRVGDFGLATWAQEEPGAAQGLAGTPGYFAPEQERGGRADALTDQFAFCVTAYEALCGALPGSAEGASPLAWPKAAGVPSRVARTVSRGLSIRPEQRFPSMDALLAAWSDPSRRRGGWLAAAAGLGLAAAIPGAVWLRAQRACAGAGNAARAAWGAAEREKGSRAFARASPTLGAAAWTRAAATMDAFSESWSAQARRACEATEVRHEQPPAMLAARMACLDQRLSDFQALVRVFGDADAVTVEKAVSAASALSAAPCEDAARLLLPPAPRPEQARAVERLRPELSEARALLAAGRFPAGLTLSRALAGRAKEAGYPRVLAEALGVQGQLEGKSGEPAAARQAFQEGELQAELARDDALATELSARLTDASVSAADLPSAELWSRHAEATLSRLGPDDALRASVERARARLLAAQARQDLAIPLLRDALARDERAWGPSHPQVGDTLFLLSDALKTTEQLPEAVQDAERAHAILAGAFGPDHPETARALVRLGQAYRDAERYPDELRCAERALQIRLAALGPEHFDVARSRWVLATALDNAGRFEEALAQYDQAVAGYERAYGKKHVFLAALQENRAEIAYELGEDARAKQAYLEADAMNRELLGPEAFKAVHATEGLGQLALEAEDVPEAERLLSGALAAAEKAIPGNPDALGALVPLARLALVRGRPAEALALLSRAEALTRKFGYLGASGRALVQVERARALRATGDAAEARRTLAEARAALEKVWGAQDRRLAPALALEAELGLDANDASGARAAAQRAVSLCQRFRCRPRDEGDGRWVLARARWALGEREGAVADAKAALASYQRAGVDASKVTRWLTEH